MHYIDVIAPQESFRHVLRLFALLTLLLMYRLDLFALTVKKSNARKPACRRRTF